MEQNELYQAIRKIAWGYVLLHVNINLNISAVSINILPNWLGYLFILGSLPVIAKEVESTSLLLPLAKVLVGAELLFWVNDCFMGGYIEFYVSLIVVRMIGLYFHFQFMTNLAELASIYGCEEERRILVLRTVYTIFVTAMCLWTMWVKGLKSVDVSNLYELIPTLVFVAVCIWICFVLFSLSQSVLEKQRELEVLNETEEKVSV